MWMMLRWSTVGGKLGSRCRAWGMTGVRGNRAMGNGGPRYTEVLDFLLICFLVFFDGFFILTEG